GGQGRPPEGRRDQVGRRPADQGPDAAVQRDLGEEAGRQGHAPDRAQRPDAADRRDARRPPEDAVSFAAPLVLLGLIAVPLLVLLYVQAERNRRAGAAAFASPKPQPSVAPTRPRWRRHVPLAA